MYFPMDEGGGDIAVDVKGGIRLIRHGSGVKPAENGWVNCAAGHRLVGTNTAFDFPEKFTLAATVRVDAGSLSDSAAPIIAFGEWDFSESFGLIVDTNRPGIGYRYGTTHSPYHGGQFIEPTYGEVYQVTVTYDGSYLRMYVDGQQTDTNGYDKDEITMPKVPQTILMFSDTGHKGFLGKIKDVMLWNRVITDSEIQTLVR
jgi:hypothetical protein